MKLPQLTFTRFLAAMAIVIHHDEGYSKPFNGVMTKHFISFLDCFVSYFFVLSGFILVVSSFHKQAVKIDKVSFWRRRFARIYPLYFFALILYLVICLSARTPNTTFTFDQFGMTALLLQSWVPHYVMTYNYPSWSLSVEFLFYFLFPFLVYLYQSIKLSTQLIINGLVWTASLLLFMRFVDSGLSKQFTHYFPLLHLSEFLVGISAAYLLIAYKEKITAYRGLLLLFASLCLVLFIIGIYFYNPFAVKYYHNGLLAPFFALVILFLAVDNAIISKWFSYKPAVYLGEISYGIYILQIPVKLLFAGVNKRMFHVSHTAEFYFYCTGLIVVSAICHELIEKPCRQWINGFKVGRFA